MHRYNIIYIKCAYLIIHIFNIIIEIHLKYPIEEL